MPGDLLSGWFRTIVERLGCFVSKKSLVRADDLMRRLIEHLIRSLLNVYFEECLPFNCAVRLTAQT